MRRPGSAPRWGPGRPGPGPLVACTPGRLWHPLRSVGRSDAEASRGGPKGDGRGVGRESGKGNRLGPSGATGVPAPLWPEQAGQPGGANTEGLPRITPFPAGATTRARGHRRVSRRGYRTRAAHEGEPVARWLNSLGVSAFVLDYRVAPTGIPCLWPTYSGPCATSGTTPGSGTSTPAG